MKHNNKSVLTVVFDRLSSDPRASKIREALKIEYEVYTISVDDGSPTEYSDHHKVIKISSKNKITRLFIFWLKVIGFIKETRPDIIFAHNYYVALPCWIGSKLFGIPLAYDAYEFYVPEKGVKFSIRNYFFFIQERFVIKRASHVFSANSERSRLMKAAFNLRNRPIPILNIPLYNKSIVRISHHTEEISIVYEGFITFTRFVDLLIESFEYLPQNYKLRIIGDGPDVNKMHRLISKKSYKARITYLGRIDGGKILPTLSQSTMGFVGYPSTNLNNRYCSPNKIYEYPAAGLPFVSTNQTSIRRVTDGYHICSFFDPQKDGARGIANAILEVANNYPYFTENIEQFNKDRSWQIEASKLLAELK